jgi:hypothetical protein
LFSDGKLTPRLAKSVSQLDTNSKKIALISMRDYFAAGI